MKKLFSKKVLIGVFTVAVLSFSYLGLNFLKSKRIFSNDNVIYAVFPQADGLEVSSPVLVKGFRIGTVEKISFDIHTAEVLVKMTVNGEYPLPYNSKAEIVSTSILGGKVMEVKLGSDDSRALASGDTITTIFAPGLVESLGQEYGQIKATVNDVIAKFSSVLDGLNKVLSDQNTKAISATLENVRSISSDLDEVVQKESSNISNIIANLSVLSASLKNVTPDIERGVKNIALLSDTLSRHAPDLIANASGAVDNLNSILKKIDQGQGTLGKVVSDEVLYDNLSLTVENLNLLIEDIKKNPKRYINVSVFGKKEK